MVSTFNRFLVLQEPDSPTPAVAGEHVQTPHRSSTLPSDSGLGGGPSDRPVPLLSDQAISATPPRRPEWGRNNYVVSAAVNAGLLKTDTRFLPKPV